MSDALRGRTIVVTRPAAQAAGLVSAIAAAGGLARSVPLLEIEPVDPAAVVAAAQANLARATLAVFISPNAVRHGLTPLRERGVWPAAARLRVAAVGQGTARALAAAGVAEVVVPPTGFDSEALLALPELGAAALAGCDAMLFKGEGGRALLADTLTARGARVHPVVCYRRLPPSGAAPALLVELVEQARLDAIVVTSSEALSHLEGLFCPTGLERLHDHLVVATHVRIADAATRAGFRRVLATAPGDDAVIAALSTYNWPSEPASAQ